MKARFCSLFAALLLITCAHALAEEHAASSPALSPGQQAQQVLDLFDKDGDGRLNKDEYAHGTVRVFESMDKDDDISLSSSELIHHDDADLKKSDTDADSELSFTEILKHQEKAFDDKDKDDDKHLSRGEIEGYIREKLEKK